MKNINMIVMVLLVSLGSLNVAASFDEDRAISVCKAIREDNLVILRKALPKSNKELREVSTHLKCNTDSLVLFAIRHKSQDTLEFLLKKLNKGYLKTLKSDIDQLGGNISYYKRIED